MRRRATGRVITVPEDGWSEAPLSEATFPTAGVVVAERPVDVAGGVPDAAEWDFDDPAPDFLVATPPVEPSTAPQLSVERPSGQVDPFDEPFPPGAEGLDATRAEDLEQLTRLERFPSLRPVDETSGAPVDRASVKASGGTVSPLKAGPRRRLGIRALAGVAAAGCVLGLGLLSVSNGSSGGQRGPGLRASMLSAGDLVEDLRSAAVRMERRAAAAEQRRRVRDRRERALRQRRTGARALASRADRAVSVRRAAVSAPPVVSAPPAAAPVASTAPAPAGRGREVSAAATEFLP